MRGRRLVFFLLIIASFVAGFVTGRTPFFSLGYLLIALVVLSFLWSWYAVRGIRLGRITRTRRAQVGRMFNETLSIRNMGFLPKLWLEVRDHSNLPNHHVSHVVPTLLGRSKYVWNVETFCVARGEFSLGPITVLSGDPFGLFTTPRKINKLERVIVYPRTVNLIRFQLPPAMLSGGEAQRQISHNITTNAVSVRDYVSGDSINRMHWKSTARRNKLTVKEFEIDPLVHISLFTDFSSHSFFGKELQHRSYYKADDQQRITIPPTTEEYSVTIAASIAKYFLEKEHSLGFTAYIPNREVYVPERGVRPLTRILHTLAVATSTSKLSFAEMLTLEMPHIPRGMTLILITSSPDMRWVRQAQLLSIRGTRVVCVYVDPESFQYTGSSAETIRALRSAEIPTLVVNNGDDLSTVLSQNPI